MCSFPYLSIHPLQDFTTRWETIDEFGTGFIEAHNITALLLSIEPPIGVKGVDNAAMKIQEIVQSVFIPLR